jgi:hypothetical protein
MINLIMIIIVTFNGKRKAIFHWLKSNILIVIVLEEAHCLSVELLLGYLFFVLTQRITIVQVSYTCLHLTGNTVIYFVLYTIQINNTQIC